MPPPAKPTDRPPRQRTDRGPGGRDRPNDRKGPKRGPKFQGGRGGDAKKKPEVKLYSQESVVDRGAEDVPDETQEGAAKRIEWTIVKRLVADQKSGKPMSTNYVLKRDGVETEFPNLGAARAAVNKTIVHPEKLTKSKGDYAASKK